MRVTAKTKVEALLPYIGALHPCGPAEIELGKYAELTVEEAWPLWRKSSWMAWFVNEVWLDMSVGEPEDDFVSEVKSRMSPRHTMSEIRRRVSLDDMIRLLNYFVRTWR